MAIKILSSNPKVSALRLISTTENSLCGINIKQFYHVDEHTMIIIGDDDQIYTNYFPVSHAVIIQ